MKASDIPASVYAEPDYDVKSEIAFQRSIEGRATRYGLKVYHTEDSRRSRKGWPDLVLAGPGGMVYRELKIPPRTTTVEQEQWLALLVQLGQDAKVWTPADMQSGEIEHTLQRLCRPLVLSDVDQLRAQVAKLQREVAVADAAAGGALTERDNAREQLAAVREELSLARTALDRVRAAADEFAGGPEFRSLVADRIRTALGGARRG